MQPNFVSAYLTGKIKEEIYILELFPELAHDKEASKLSKNKVFHLNKVLYRLKQSDKC